MDCGAGVWRHVTPFFPPHSSNHSWAWSPTPIGQSARASCRDPFSAACPTLSDCLGTAANLSNPCFSWFAGRVIALCACGQYRLHAQRRPVSNRFPPPSVSHLSDGLLSSSAGVQTQRRKEAACLRSLAVVIFTALIFSRSRMGILSALASLMAVLALAGSSSLSKRTQAVVAALFFIGIIGIVAWVGSDPVVMRFEVLGQEYAQTGQNRISIWRDTLNLIHQHPLLGTGLGTFSVAYTSVQTAFLNHLVDHAHCDYLEVVSELGVPGGILVFGSIFWILARAVRRYRKAEDRFDAAVCLGCIGSIAAILMHSLADFNLYIPANALVFVVTLALAWMGS